MFLLLQICVFLSGGVALILEAVYQKYLATLIGSSTPSATIVLVTYFLGISLGALICPKKGGEPRRRLAFLELFISVWSLILATFFYKSYDVTMVMLADWSDSAWTLGFMRWLISAFWILPPTMAMGAHLPTLECFLENNGFGKPFYLTRLYALNTAGACFFTFVTPVLFFQNVGLEGTLFISMAIGISVSATLFFGLRKNQKNDIESATLTHLVQQENSLPDQSTREFNQYWPIALAFMSGGLVFSLEVIWNHLVSSVMGASTYSFSIILGVVLLSLAIATHRVETLSPAGPEKARQVVMHAFKQLALMLPLTMILWEWSGKLLAVCRQIFELRSFWSGELLKVLVAYILIKPLASAAGMLFPATFYAYSDGRAPSGREVGFLNVSNTVGCVLGALIGNYILIPTIGAQWSFVLFWIVICIFGLYLWKTSGSFPKRAELTRRKTIKYASVVALSSAPMLILLVSGGWNMDRMLAGYGVYLGGQYYSNGKTVYIHEDQHSGFVSVRVNDNLLNLGKTTTLLQNGKFDANDTGEVPAQIGFGLISSMFPEKMTRALVIGFGSGQTTSIIHDMGFQTIDVCEMSEGHIEAAQKYFSKINKNVLDQDNVHLWIEDGRNFLARTKYRYDAISIEITSIWFSGASNLYSLEFYKHAKAHLTNGGILQQWMQLHHLSTKEFTTALATMRKSFNYVEMWLNDGQVVFIASDEPLLFHGDRLERYKNSPAFAFERKFVPVDKINELYQRFLSSQEVDCVLQKIPHVINTDANKWLEFKTPMYYLDERDLASMILNDLNAARNCTEQGDVR